MIPNRARTWKNEGLNYSILFVLRLLLFFFYYQRLTIAGLIKLEDTSNKTLAALVTLLFLLFFLCLSLVFTLVYKIKKKVNNIFYGVFCCFFWFLGMVICIEKKTNVSCALSMNGMLFCSWM